eukprot:5237214-Amphidinium_carterae.1
MFWGVLLADASRANVVARNRHEFLVLAAETQQSSGISLTHWRLNPSSTGITSPCWRNRLSGHLQVDNFEVGAINAIQQSCKKSKL